MIESRTIGEPSSMIVLPVPRVKELCANMMSVAFSTSQSDRSPFGMAVARVAFMGIGAVNALLVTALAARWGRRSAIAAGVLYACWLPAVYSETSTLLEPLGGTALLAALLLLRTGNRRAGPSARAEVLAGVVLGLACTVKIWYAAPFAVLVAHQAVTRRYPSARRVAAGGVGSATVVLLPFFLVAPSRMWQMVVRDQVLRAPPPSARGSRLASIVGVHNLITEPQVQTVATALAMVALVAAAVVCWTDRSARVVVTVLAVNLLVLLAGPSYFVHYAALTAAPAALVIGIALGRPTTRPRLRPVATALLAAGLAVFLASGARILTRPAGRAFPAAAFTRAAPAGCITADDPQALIQMNRLSRDLRHGCRVLVDVTGITYDTLRRTTPDGRPVPRARNQAFQQYLTAYLTAGSAFVLLRPASDGMPPAARRDLRRRRALSRADGLVLRAGTG